MLIEQIIKFELSALGPFGRTSATSYFYHKTKISQENLGVDYYLLLKYCTRKCRLPCFPLTRPNHLQNLNLKCKFLNVTSKLKLD